LRHQSQIAPSSSLRNCIEQTEHHLDEVVYIVFLERDAFIAGLLQFLQQHVEGRPVPLLDLLLNKRTEGFPSRHVQGVQNVLNNGNYRQGTRLARGHLSFFPQLRRTPNLKILAQPDAGRSRDT
jgi:hypothetical protein